MTVHYMTVSLTLWLGYSQLMIKQSLSLLVMLMLITLSGWSLSLLLIGMGMMLLIFGICQIVSSWFAVPLTLLVTDSILWWRMFLTVDVFVGTPLGTVDHCFVNCVLRFEQSVSEYNIRSTVFLKNHTNWDNIRFAVRSLTWSNILKSTDPLDAFNWAIGEVIGRLVPITVLHSISGDKQWFDASCQRAYDAKQTAYHAWCRACSADNCGWYVLAGAETQRVYCAARESHNECTRNTLKHSTCSHKWWEILKGSIFGVKPSISAIRGALRWCGGSSCWESITLGLSVWQSAVPGAVCPTFVLFPSV